MQRGIEKEKYNNNVFISRHEPCSMFHVPCSRPYHKTYLLGKWEVLCLFRSRLLQHSNVTNKRKHFCFAASINKVKVGEACMQDAIPSRPFVYLLLLVFYERLDFYYSFRIFHISLFNHLSHKYIKRR